MPFVGLGFTFHVLHVIVTGTMCPLYMCEHLNYQRLELKQVVCKEFCNSIKIY
jgi:hypothetical protein